MLIDTEADVNLTKFKVLKGNIIKDSQSCDSLSIIIIFDAGQTFGTTKANLNFYNVTIIYILHVVDNNHSISGFGVLENDFFLDIVI